MRHRLKPVLHRRRCKRHHGEQAIGQRALNWWQIAAGACGPPEIRKALAGLIRAAAGQTVGKHHRVEGTGRRAGNSGNLEPPVGKQLVQHAPCKGPMGAATLKREVDFFRGAGLAHASEIPRREAVEVGFEIGRQGCASFSLARRNPRPAFRPM